MLGITSVSAATLAKFGFIYLACEFSIWLLLGIFNIILLKEELEKVPTV